MEEKIVFEDENVKVTNMRVTCNHVTIPVEKIDQVRSNVRVDLLVLAFVCFLLSFVPFYFYSIPPMIVIGVVLVISTFIWLTRVCKSYVELLVNVGPNRVRLLQGGMKDKEYVFGVAEEVAKVIITERKLNSRIDNLGDRIPAHIHPSQTMMLRMAQDDIKHEERDKAKAEAREKAKAAGQPEATENPETSQEESKDSSEPKVGE